MKTATYTPERLSAAAASKKVSDEQIARAKAVDVASLVGGYVTLGKEGPREFSGPCPKCKGTDRFHCTATWWTCRQCGPKHKGAPSRGDAIDFIMWKDKVDFRRAVEILTGDELPKGAKLIEPAEKSQQSDGYNWEHPSWQRDAQKALTAAQAALWDSTAGRAGRSYLEGRGLHSGAWVAYGLGYSHAVSVPGIEGKQKGAAIAIPWIMKGTLRAIRYRFLEQQGPHKQTAFFGSTFSGNVYGGQFIQRSGFERRTLVLIEGEINAMSIWQVAADTRLDVLSIGSESQRISDEMLNAIRRYRMVLLWLDNAKHARAKLEKLPSATAFQSPGGKDANDLLQAGTLGYAFSNMRLKAAQTVDQRRELLHDLCAGFNSWNGVDAGTLAVLRQLDRSEELAP